MESVETENKNKQRIKTNQCAPGWARNSVENRRNPVFLSYNKVMLSEEEVKKNLVGSNITTYCIAAFAEVMFAGMAIMLIMFFYTDKEEYGNQALAILVPAVMIFTAINIVLTRKSVKRYQDVSDNPAVLYYGSLGDLTKALNEAREQPILFESKENGGVVLTKDYIYNRTHYSMIRRVKDLDEYTYRVAEYRTMTCPRVYELIFVMSNKNYCSFHFSSREEMNRCLEAVKNLRPNMPAFSLETAIMNSGR